MDLEGSWSDLGRILEPSWGAIWGPDRSKIDKKVTKNQMHFVIDFLTDLGVQGKKDFGVLNRPERKG